MPRVIYEDAKVDGTTVVVMEIHRGRKWLMMKTAYKRK